MTGDVDDKGGCDCRTQQQWRKVEDLLRSRELVSKPGSHPECRLGTQNFGDVSEEPSSDSESVSRPKRG
jgi:hypothetical protein